MTKNRIPEWLSLIEIGLAFGALLVVEQRLPFSPAADMWLLIGWTFLFYGAIGHWISRNQIALERQPAPRDCAGRSIIECDPVSEFEPDSIMSHQMKQDHRAARPTAQPITPRSEVA
ncbi:MAG: hypothetical protein KJ046_11230 [Anaerolineae bacterium]|nr:hypothetical protein [Anaerolineae bacterium]